MRKARTTTLVEIAGGVVYTMYESVKQYECTAVHPGKSFTTRFIQVLFHCLCRKYTIVATICILGLIVLKVFEMSVRQKTSFPEKGQISLHSLERGSARQNGDHVKSRNLIPIRVLIVAYYRSGSSLCGSIFDDFAGAFYSFEPLVPLYTYTIPNGHPLKYLNGTIRKCPDGAGEDRQIAKDIFSAVFDCRFQDVDVDAITMMSCGVNVNSSTEFCECKIRKGWRDIFLNCIPDYSKLCLKSAYRVIKTIRVDMDMVESLLEIYPDLKIIHVMRDPRGRVCSGIVARKCNVTETLVRQVCDIGTRDVLKRKVLEDKYPGSFKEVIYEDMVADPIRTFEAIFTFVGIKLPNYVKVILQKKTRYGGTNNGPYGTYRANGLVTAYKWSRTIPWSVLEHVNRHCEQFLDLGKFPKITSQEELISFQIPDRRISNGNN